MGESPDSFTEVTSQSWGSRIVSSIKGIIFGSVLIVAAVVLLWWNEGRAVKMAKSLDEGAGAVVPVAADKADPANEGKLVHLTGTATTTATLAFGDFGVSANALRLRRDVQMYQWRQEVSSTTTKKIGGSTETTHTYKYEKTWSPTLISSSDFKQPEGHANPAAMRFTEESLEAQPVTLGGFQLSPALVGMINNFESFPVTADQSARLADPLKKELKTAEAGYYLGADPANPAVGDMKIRFEIVKPVEVSLMAQQLGNSFGPYPTVAGNPIQLLKVGQFSAAEMIQQAQSSNSTLTWILRLVGGLVMWFGFALVFGPLAVLADVLPFLGDLVSVGTGLIAGAAALGISLIVIAAAWFFYRPVLAIVLILVAAAAVFGIVRLFKGRKKPAQPDAPKGPGGGATAEAPASAPATATAPGAAPDAASGKDRNSVFIVGMVVGLAVIAILAAIAFGASALFKAKAPAESPAAPGPVATVPAPKRAPEPPVATVPAPKPAPEPAAIVAAPKPESPLSKYQVIAPMVGTGDIHFGMTEAQIAGVLGKPDAQDRDSRTYYAQGLRFGFDAGGLAAIGTLNKAGLPPEWAAKVTEFDFRTPAGIKLGDPEAEIVAVYGNADAMSSTGLQEKTLIYLNKCLQFVLNENKLYAILALRSYTPPPQTPAPLQGLPDIKMGMSPQEVHAILGMPDKPARGGADSRCVYSGRGLYLKFSRTFGLDRIICMAQSAGALYLQADDSRAANLHDSAAQTAEGIRIGSTLEELQAACGKALVAESDFNQAKSYAVFLKGTPGAGSLHIHYRISNGLVAAIEVTRLAPQTPHYRWWPELDTRRPATFKARP